MALPLASKAWTSKRLSLSEFRDDGGRPFDPAAHAGTISFQLAPTQIGDTPVTVWLHSVALLNDQPVRACWQSAAAFDEVDVDNLRAAHRPQPPPPAVAQRQPLVRFTAPAPNYLTNWADKTLPHSTPLVTIERLAPAGEAPFLRVTFPAGECAWGNANIPLPAGLLKGQDGLALRLRASSGEDIGLALHTGSNGQQTFYRTEVEAGEAWSEQILPWPEFKADDGRAFAPERAGFVNLQLCRPPRKLTQNVVIDIETIDAISAR
jgi:hypothetical protein